MKNWEYKKLGETYNFIDYRGMTPNKIDEGIPLITAKNVRMGYIDYSIKDFISEEDYKNRQSRGISHKGDILFTTEAPLGYSALADLDVFSTGQRIITFQQLDNEKNLFNPFYNYYFQSTEFQKLVKENATGLTATGIKASRLREIPVPLPPLEEQKRIVKILDEKFAQLETVKANAKANLQNAKDLFQSQLTKAFSNNSWEKKVLLKDIAKDFSRGKSKHRPRNDKCLFGGDYPFIQTGDIRNTEKYITEYTDTYNETGLAQSKLWPEGTLCITIAANIAETAILTFPCCFPDSVIGFVPNEDIATADYVFYLLQFFKAELQILGKGAAQDNINLGTFEKMQFPLPPLPEQKRIVEQLDSLSPKVRSLEEIYTKQLANCDELKQAFLAKAFAGEL